MTEPQTVTSTASGQWEDQVRDALGRVVASGGFVHSERLCRLLRHCVEQALDRHPDRLKETAIGMDVFDRGPTFDPGSDTIVRVESRRLRHKLEEYYRGEGHADALEIVLTPGSYVPMFRPRASVPATIGSSIDQCSASIAILPFWNLSGSVEMERFCDGLTEELITTLARVRGLHVVARTSVFQFKGKPADIRHIATLLNVQTVLEGSVRQAGSQVRVTAQQINAADGYYLWSASLDREFHEGFALQEELTEAICALLRERGSVGGV